MGIFKQKENARILLRNEYNTGVVSTGDERL
jgi:hypothetical protein